MSNELKANQRINTIFSLKNVFTNFISTVFDLVFALYLVASLLVHKIVNACS